MKTTLIAFLKGAWLGPVKTTLVALLGGALSLGQLPFSRMPRFSGTLEQPVTMNHKIHAGDYQMPCLYCHANARRSTVAGIPSVQFCMGCHKITGLALPTVQKLKGYWDRKEPIPWVKVFYQPDFVHFSHVAHVRVGVTCQTCHGPVQTMDRFPNRVFITMDQCVACHRQQQASIDCVMCHK